MAYAVLEKKIVHTVAWC